MRVNRKPFRYGPGLIAILASVAVVVGVAFGLAAFWQSREIQAQQVDLELPLVPDRASSSSEEESAVWPDKATHTDSPQQEADAAAELSALFTGRLTWHDPVEASWFEDAVFIGDTSSLSIGRYQVAKGAAVLALPGLTPEAALTDAAFSTGEQMISFMGVLHEIQPRGKAYIMLGADALAQGASQEELLAGYRLLLTELKKNFPGMAVYVQSVLPVTAACQTENPSLTTENIQQYNLALMNLAGEVGAYYIHPAGAVQNSAGALPELASPVDGMHLTAEYHVKWFDYLRSHTAAKAQV
ncbi:GDSL-type esterase/lipase family protein [Oscillospiraceae bacterium MB08-C2-2]|nr:GDSL-type esterase/lipase family protein [Oscillospiraceae bacterium MB08-C2-2]